MNTPESPANAPEITTARYFIRYTGTPSDSAAPGFSPTDRSRNPQRVRQSTHHENGTNATAMSVRIDKLAVRPCTTPATSETKNHRLASSQSSTSGECQPNTLPPDSTGKLNTPMWPPTSGDCVTPPPVSGVYATDDRKRAIPPPRRLMATPETMWSTLN